MTEPRPPQITPVHLAKVAVVYGRVSTPRQARDSTGSIEHQRNQQAHALAWGWRADQIRHHEDLGRSGTRADNRTAFQELLKLVSDGRVGAVLVANAARLSRAVQDFEALVALCRFRQTLLVIEGRVLDLNDPASRLMARIEGGVADYENSLRIKNSVDGKYAKARLGHAVSLPPTGYVVTTKGQWAKDADQAVQQAIEQVFRLFRQLGSAPRSCGRWPGLRRCSPSGPARGSRVGCVPISPACT
ncbi:MAG: recombinase family protein [Candidatus Methylomirabilis sp.]|nr:recombinase family protein [Candidatus Methylomirabilis sp.]